MSHFFPCMLHQINVKLHENSVIFNLVIVLFSNTECKSIHMTYIAYHAVSHLVVMHTTMPQMTSRSVHWNPVVSKAAKLAQKLWKAPNGITIMPQSRGISSWTFPPRTYSPTLTFPLFSMVYDLSPFHHHRPPVYNIKKSTVNVFKIDSGRLVMVRNTG